MDEKVQKSLIPYDLESLKGSIEKHEQNILAMETAIRTERQLITDEQFMIATLEAKQTELNGSKN